MIKSDRILEEIPKLFHLDLNRDESSLFRAISKLFEFNEGYIFFANPDSVQLKYKYVFNKSITDLSTEDIIPISKELKNRIFSLDGEILDTNDKLVSNLRLSNSINKSFLMSKITINTTVFGFIVLCSEKDKIYSSTDLTSLNAVSSVVAYLLKDKELSNVFKIQLKALKDSVVETKNAYKTIKEQNKKILEADKIKNEFLANISHELRTPLNSILGFAEILTTELYGSLNAKQYEYIDDIKASGTHLLGMINEILDMSKIEANAMRIVKSTFWISRAVDEVSNILMPLAKKKNLKIIKNMEEDFQVFADYQKIQQILYNLMSNAIKFSPENSEVEIGVYNQGDTFKLTVHDNGIGIDKKYYGKIFAKFVQLDSAYTKKESSTGLGLTITKELVELHEGKISLISEINNGTTFIVEIPF